VFISFDGVDGAGKSTQIELLGKWLTERGDEIVTCRDPGSTELGERLRELLLNHHDWAISMRAEMLIYMAARAQLVDQIIEPALAAGKSVICDRFLLANVVYQGHAGGLDVNQLWDVGRIAVGNAFPDLTILLDIDVGVACQRRTGRPDRLESRGTAYQQRVRDGFLR